MHLADIIFGKKTNPLLQKKSSSRKARQLRFEGLESREMLSITGFEAAGAHDVHNVLRYDGSQTNWQYEQGSSIRSDSMVVLQTESGTVSVKLSGRSDNTAANLAWKLNESNAGQYWNAASGSSNSNVLSTELVWSGQSDSPARDFSITLWEDVNKDGVLDASERNSAKTFSISVQWVKVSLCADQPVAGNEAPIYIGYTGNNVMDLMDIDKHLEADVGHVYWDIRTGSALASASAFQDYSYLANNSWGYAYRGGDPAMGIMETGNFSAPGVCESNNGWDTNAYQSFCVDTIGNYVNLLKFTDNKIKNPGTYKLMDDQFGPAHQCTTVALDAMKAAGINVPVSSQTYTVDLPPKLKDHILQAIALGQGSYIQSVAPFVYDKAIRGDYTFEYKGYSPGAVGVYITSHGGAYADFTRLPSSELNSPFLNIKTPSAPTNVAAVALSATSAKITWNAVSGATKYQIKSYDATTNQWTTLTTEAVGNAYTATISTSDVTQFSVSAVSASGTSPATTANLLKAPAGASAVALSATSAKFTWNKSTGATSYQLLAYDSAGNQWVSLGTVSETSHTISNLTDSMTQVVVHAVNAAGRTTGTTATILRTPTALQAVVASGAKTQISWNKATGATSYDIMGYNAAGKYWWKIDSTMNTSYSAPAYTTNVTTIAVHAINAAGRTVGAATSLFRGPTNVSAVVASATQTKISWNAVAGATSYDIMGYNKAGNYWWKIDTVQGTSYTAPAYTTNVTTIAVHANRGSSRTMGVTTSLARAPSGVAASSLSETSALFTWNAVAGASQYELAIYNSVTKKWSILGRTTNLSYTATNLAPGVTLVSVHSINAAGRSIGATASVQ